MFKLEAHILLKSLFETIASAVTIYNTTSLSPYCIVSVQEILNPRCILGHKIGGFRASEGLTNK